MSAPITSNERTPLDASSRGRSIVVATDGSVEAEAAFRVAIALAARENLALRIVTVLQPSPSPTAESAPAEPLDVERRMARELLDRLDAVAALSLPAERVRTSLLVGPPWSVIVDEAVAWSAARIVVGCAHRGRIQRRVAGDTALYVVRHSRVPVIVVPATSSTLPARAVVAVDFDAANMDIVRTAASVVGDGGMLLLTHVRPEASSSADPSFGVRSGWSYLYEDAASTLLQHLARTASREFPTFDIRTAVVDGDAAASLTALAEREGMGLIAVGQHVHELVERQLFGSVVETLLRGASRMVVVTPRPTR